MSEVPGARPVHSEKHGLRVARASICSLCQCGCSARHPELPEAKGEVEQAHPQHRVAFLAGRSAREAQL